MIIFFILLAGGMVFYAKISSYTSKQQQEENQDVNAISIEQRIRHMSEIACTTDAVVIFDCYDLSKIHALEQVIPNHNLYYESIIFKNSKVTITSVYPTEDEILLFEPGDTNQSMSSQPFRTPVTLYDPVSDTTNFGYITVEVYS
ncbi:MAG: hypothetical protein WC254_04770 [Candidatus Woesearchaeota archaeon]